MKSTLKAALNHTTLAAFAAASLLSSTTFSNAAGYMKLGDIKGESIDDSHQEWSDILSVSWGVRRAGGGATGATRRRGDVVLEDITCTKYLDKSSPKLMEACVTGEIIPKLEIEQTATYEGGVRATYYAYELTNVMVTSYRMASKGGTNAAGVEEKPKVEVSLSFEEIKVTYTENDSKGKKKGNVEYSWKVEEGEG